ncbi:MAG: DUF4062 domain-containing protein, partial [Victivallales bacterium]|nr:DUF4062 domain-containing protein [Victivallales bacterium]
MRKRIFISSVQKEFAEDRAFLKRFIEGNPILNRFFNVFVFEEDVPAADRTTAEVFLSEIANSDIYLGLIGNQYGFEDSAGISPTEREFDEATRLGLERLILVKGHDDQKREPKEIAFLRKISPELIRRRYEGRDALLTEIYASLDHILAGDGAYHLLPFDARPCDHATVDDIDENKVRWFVSRAREERGFPLALGTSVSDILSHLKLLDRDSQRPLNAAILLFGKNPQDYHLSSEVKCAYWHGTERIKPISSYKVYRGTLFDMADQAVDFIMSKLDRRIGTRVHGTTAPATYEIPEPVISEIIINA